MKVRLTADLYKNVVGIRDSVIFAKKGEIVETGPISEKVDWLVGCRYAKLLNPVDPQRERHLGEGYEFEIVET